MPDPNTFPAIGWVFVALIGIAAGVDLFLRVMDRFKEQPPPSQTYVTKPEFKVSEEGIKTRVVRLEDDVRGIQSEMKRDKAELMEAGERRKDELKSHISQVVSRVHERVDRILEGKSK